MTDNYKVDNPNALALRRWKLGHQAFHYLLVGMIASIQRCTKLLRTGDHTRLAAELKELASLYRAATSAFNYAAAFDPHSYISVVRPSMMPPHLPEGFSGTLNEKHNDMKQGLRDLQQEITPLLKMSGGEYLHEAWQILLEAKTENLQNHGRVCNRFVPGVRSLLREYYAKGGDKQ